MSCLHPINTGQCCAYGTNGIVYDGATPKYKLEIDAGIPMTGFNFQVELVGTSGDITIPKSQMATDAENNYYVCFDTQELGIGNVKAVVTAYIPDTDFDNNVRIEIYVVNPLVEIRKV